MDASAHFRGKRITVMGLGLLGRGVGDARYLAQCGAELIVTDLKSREELVESVAQLESFPNITFVLGEHRLEDFRDRDMILKAAGVPLDSPYIAEAKKNGIPVRMSTDLFAEISQLPIIGITGTRGKSSVTHMLFNILNTAYELGLNLSEGEVGRTGLLRKPVLGGNVRGVSTLALLNEASPDCTAILELDSWQLQGFGEAKISPHIAVFTTLYSDHLNYYKNDLGAYLADKANIFIHQSESDTLVLGKQCAPTIIDRYGEQIESKIIVADELKLPDTWILRVPGRHNRYNAALALAAARAYGISDDISKSALEKFPGVPGRLEFIAEKNGVKIYNDTTATTPDATLAALDALQSVAPSGIILIMGGADKGLEMDALLSALPEATKRVILLSGTGTDRIKDAVQGGMIYHTLSDAVASAFADAVQGDIILFSPAFASFGMFKNEYDRGDQFNAVVQSL
ncbi:MAG: UDP-N-acetylmuramoyl-L-alanine--D-glutamate ligase [Minisyncoccia bacterium]